MLALLLFYFMKEKEEITKTPAYTHLSTLSELRELKKIGHESL